LSLTLFHRDFFAEKHTSAVVASHNAGAGLARPVGAQSESPGAERIGAGALDGGWARSEGQV